MCCRIVPTYKTIKNNEAQKNSCSLTTFFLHHGQEVMAYTRANQVCRKLAKIKAIMLLHWMLEKHKKEQLRYMSKMDL